MTILRVFEQAGGDKVLAGKMLGISRATLYRKLKRYNIPLRNAHPAEKELVARRLKSASCAINLLNPGSRHSRFQPLA